MPELPEVETVRRGLSRKIIGRRIAGCLVREPRLRWPLDVRALQQTTHDKVIVQIRRRAKYLLLDLVHAGAPRGSPTHALVVHLGMTGWVGIRPAPPWHKHDHVLFALDDGTHLCFNDARRFGSIHVLAADEEAVFARFVHLGVEPLSEEAFTAEYLFRSCRRRVQPIKERLMDARCVVGVGNIYASESLFLARVHPLMPAGKLSQRRAATVTDAVRSTLRDAIERGGTTLRDFLNADGLQGLFAPRLRVYGKEGLPCPRCEGKIRRVVLGGRSTFYCPRCQTR